MGGVTSVMPVIRNTRSATQWAHTIDWMVRCDWLQLASCKLYYANGGCKTCASLQDLQVLFMMRKSHIQFLVVS